MVAGQVFAQAILFLALPFISRNFSASEIGQWSVFQALAIFLWSFSQLKTDLSLVQADTEEERRGLVRTGWAVHLLVTALCVVLLRTTGLDERLHLNYGWLLWLYLAGFGLNQMVQNYLLSKQLYDELTAIKWLTPLLCFPGSLLLMFLEVPNGLLIGLIVGVWIPALRSFWQHKILAGWTFASTANIKTYWQKYKKNATLGSVIAIISSLSDQLLVLLIANYFKEDMIAAYFMAVRFCTAPISLISASIGQYNFRVYQELHKKGQFLPKVPVEHWKKWLLVALAYYGTMILFGREIFGFLLGADWRYAGYLASLLAVPNMLIFLTSPTSLAFTVIQKQEYVMALSPVILIQMLCMLMAIFYDHQMETFVLVYAITTVLYTIFFNGVMLFAISKAQPKI